MKNSKPILSAAVAVHAILGIGAVSAADLPARTYAKAPVIADPGYNWTGFYVGLNGGYGWQDPTVNYTPNDILTQQITVGGIFGGTAVPAASFNIKGALGGAQAGYNWQFNRSWLLAVETDFDWSNIHGTGISNFQLGPSPLSNLIASQNIDWFGTVRVRLGWLPMNKLLVYGTGGFAYGQVQESVALNSSAGTEIFRADDSFGLKCVLGPNCFLGASSRTATGWTAGAGLEYSFWRNVSLKVEYLYVNLGHGGTVNVVALNSSEAVAPGSFSAHYGTVDFNVVRAGLNARF